MKAPKAPRSSARPAQLEDLLERREAASPAARARLDRDAHALFAERAVVFTDIVRTFTHRVERDGILHFLDAVPGRGRGVRGGRGGPRRALREVGGGLAAAGAPRSRPAACAGVRAMQRAARGTKASLRDRLRFSYGIG